MQWVLSFIFKVKVKLQTLTSVAKSPLETPSSMAMHW